MMKHYHIQIDGMGCMHCVHSVTDALKNAGAAVERCDIGSADVSFDGDVQSLSDAVADRGFAVTAVDER